MTATIVQLRDYKSPEERQIEIDRFGLKVVEHALYDNAPSDMPSPVYLAPERDPA